MFTTTDYQRCKFLLERAQMYLAKNDTLAAGVCTHEVAEIYKREGIPSMATYNANCLHFLKVEEKQQVELMLMELPIPFDEVTTETEAQEQAERENIKRAWWWYDYYRDAGSVGMSDHHTETKLLALMRG